MQLDQEEREAVNCLADAVREHRELVEFKQQHENTRLNRLEFLCFLSTILGTLSALVFLVSFITNPFASWTQRCEITQHTEDFSVQICTKK